LGDAAQSNQPPENYAPVDEATSEQEHTSGHVSNPPSTQSFDGHFPLSNSDFTSRFFGSSSVFVLTVQLSNRVLNDPTQFNPPDSPGLSFGFSEEGFNNLVTAAACRTSSPSREMLTALLGYYKSSLNTIYPFVDEATLQADLEVYLEHQPLGGRLHGKAAYQYFRISMICAIACANKSRHMRHLVASDDDFYAEGLKHVESVTSEMSGDSLQALLLLIVYCLFHPRKGDIWKLLDYACRLSVELGYHTELPMYDETSKDMSLRRSTFWSLYTLERIIGQIFGRPSDLPEQIITTDYPGILATGSPTDEESVQVFSAAHHYRLVYLRSEIYREIYLSTTPLTHDLEWFVGRYFALMSWYDATLLGESLAGVGTSTCNVAFHSTIVFLFQPLLLKALSEQHQTDTKVTVLPSENYRSACELIRTYEKIVRSPDDTALGIYPMTIMSAHYIYLAGLTIMSYVSISIEGRIQILGPLTQDALDRQLQPIDYSDIYRISGSCLVLLTWCANTWVGMSGMLGMYRKLSEKLLPLLAKAGLS
jgi:hypothetical protein